MNPTTGLTRHPPAHIRCLILRAEAPVQPVQDEQMQHRKAVR